MNTLYPVILHSAAWSDIHRPFQTLVLSDPGNTGFIYQRAVPSTPQKETSGKNNSVPRFITSNVQKKKRIING
jgi:hypothetical protein